MSDGNGERAERSFRVWKDGGLDRPQSRFALPTPHVSGNVEFVFIPSVQGCLATNFHPLSPPISLTFSSPLQHPERDVETLPLLHPRPLWRFHHISDHFAGVGCHGWLHILVLGMVP